jgi:thymidylate synthase ThyX
MTQSHVPRVLTVAPMPPEQIAYALARYSRSPDSIAASIDWVKAHDSAKFLDSFYFQYGHASIADLGHLVVCFEGISELAATEIEDEQLWDGQARSSRYQDFGNTGFITPGDLSPQETASYQAAASKLLDAYRIIHDRMDAFLHEQLPRPLEMKQDAYDRNLKARAFDVARYCLFLGVPTGVGQVVSIRTLERQIRRMKGSQYSELVGLGEETAEACAQPPLCGGGVPLAPTLAKYVNAETHAPQALKDLEQWVAQNLSFKSDLAKDPEPVDLLRPADALTDIVATLIYTATNRPYRELYELVWAWSVAQRNEVVDVALKSRTQRDELLREFRSGTYVYDFVMDIGAYRDMHRHRRCQQFRQSYGTHLGFSVPGGVEAAGLSSLYSGALETVRNVIDSLPSPSSDYLLPFATKGRFLFKMDFAEAAYIARLRSGVKGHFSYRDIAWRMKLKMEELEPSLAKLIEATPPWVEDPLQR